MLKSDPGCSKSRSAFHAIITNKIVSRETVFFIVLNSGYINYVFFLNTKMIATNIPLLQSNSSGFSSVRNNMIRTWNIYEELYAVIDPHCG